VILVVVENLFLTEQMAVLVASVCTRKDPNGYCKQLLLSVTIW